MKINKNTDYTLIIYSNIPESTDLFLVPSDTISGEELDLLLMADGKYINSDDTNNGMTFLSNALSTKKEYCMDGSPELYCKYSKFKVKDNPMSGGGFKISRVIVSGFFL